MSWFYLPLWLPREAVTLGLGNRMANQWDADEPGMVEQLRDRIVREALPILESIRTPYDVVRAIRAGMTDRQPTLREQEELAYALARANDDRAIEAFDKLLTLFDPAVEWHREMAARAVSFRDGLVRNPDAALRQLLAWEQESLGNLELEKFASSLKSCHDSSE